MKKELKIAEIFTLEQKSPLELPIFSARISAGFPSPADDYIENKLDLNEFLVQHPAATFFVRVEGDSMTEAGINSGDLLVVDRALETVNNCIVVAIINGEFTVKRISKNRGKIFLQPENPSYKALEITPEMDFKIWGRVSYVIHKL